jgi:uncharacterized protein
VSWRGLDEWRAEAAEIEFLDGGGVSVRGVQLGAGSRVDYSLHTDAAWRTMRFDVRCVDAGGAVRHLEILPGDLGEDVVDVDLAFSPLTNLMPVRRSGLATDPGAEDFVMAWVSLPELEVSRSEQRYEHVRPGVVRYVDRGVHDGFKAELELDEDGLVVRYPGLAERAG